MQYAGYVDVDLKANNCLKISDVLLVTQKWGGKGTGNHCIIVPENSFTSQHLTEQ